jgi:two-component system response regulator GlrR
MAEGQFRADLFYRLNVVTSLLPSERREDIPLANHFWSSWPLVRQAPERFAPEAVKALTTAAWPGNVRQLFNVVEQVCASTTPQCR